MSQDSVTTRWQSGEEEHFLPSETFKTRQQDKSVTTRPLGYESFQIRWWKVFFLFWDSVTTTLLTNKQGNNKILSKLGGKLRKKSTFYPLTLSKQAHNTILSQLGAGLVKKSSFHLLTLSKQRQNKILSQLGGRLEKKSTFSPWENVTTRFCHNYVAEWWKRALFTFQNFQIKVETQGGWGVKKQCHNKVTELKNCKTRWLTGEEEHFSNSDESVTWLWQGIW